MHPHIPSTTMGDDMPDMHMVESQLSLIRNMTDHNTFKHNNNMNNNNNTNETKQQCNHNTSCADVITVSNHEEQTTQSL